MLATGYARTYRTNAILTASPGQLVLLLFDAALNSLAIARKACDEAPADPRKLEVVHTQLVKAQKIIAELQGTLNLEAGGEEEIRGLRKLPAKKRSATSNKARGTNTRKSPAKRGAAKPGNGRSRSTRKKSTR